MRQIYNFIREKVTVSAKWTVAFLLEYMPADFKTDMKNKLTITILLILSLAWAGCSKSDIEELRKELDRQTELLAQLQFKLTAQADILSMEVLVFSKVKFNVLQEHGMEQSLILFFLFR